MLLGDDLPSDVLWKIGKKNLQTSLHSDSQRCSYFQSAILTKHSLAVFNRGSLLLPTQHKSLFICLTLIPPKRGNLMTTVQWGLPEEAFPSKASSELFRTVPKSVNTILQFFSVMFCGNGFNETRKKYLKKNSLKKTVTE